MTTESENPIHEAAVAVIEESEDAQRLLMRALMWARLKRELVKIEE